MFLHQAIQMVLQQSSNKPLTVKEIASAINQQQFFRNEDGSEVTPEQVAVGAIQANTETELYNLDVLINLRKNTPKVYMNGKQMKLADIRAQVRIDKIRAKAAKLSKT